MPDWSEEELEELEGELLQRIKRDLKKRDKIKQRISFRIDDKIISEKDICEKCGKEFIKNRTWQKYCTNKCLFGKSDEEM